MKLTIIILATALAASLTWNLLPKSQASGVVEFRYAYDAESVHEKIDGDLANDKAMASLVYLTIMRNPNYVENAPNSGEWYIVTLRETK